MNNNIKAITHTEHWEKVTVNSSSVHSGLQAVWLVRSVDLDLKNHFWFYMSGVKRPSADEMLPWVFNLMGLQREGETDKLSGEAKQYQSRSIAAHRLPKTPSCSSGACPDVTDSSYRHAGEHTQCWATLWKQVHGLTSDWAPFADEGTWTWSQNYTQTSTNLK